MHDFHIPTVPQGRVLESNPADNTLKKSIEIELATIAAQRGIGIPTHHLGSHGTAAAVCGAAHDSVFILCKPGAL